MIVSELAQRAGIPAHVVRYYARIGLLKPNRHPENGYKLFRNDDLNRIHFIRQAKELGFKLNEIEELMERARQGESICPDVRKLLRLRIEQSRSEIERLRHQLNYMEAALRRWEQTPDSPPNGEMLCPLIESSCCH